MSRGHVVLAKQVGILLLQRRRSAAEFCCAGGVWEPCVSDRLLPKQASVGPSTPCLPQPPCTKSEQPSNKGAGPWSPTASQLSQGKRESAGQPGCSNIRTARTYSSAAGGSTCVTTCLSCPCTADSTMHIGAPSQVSRCPHIFWRFASTMMTSWTLRKACGYSMLQGQVLRQC